MLAPKSALRSQGRHESLGRLTSSRAKSSPASQGRGPCRARGPTDSYPPGLLTSSPTGITQTPGATEACSAVITRAAMLPPSPGRPAPSPPRWLCPWGTHSLGCVSGAVRRVTGTDRNLPKDEVATTTPAAGVQGAASCSGALAVRARARVRVLRAPPRAPSARSRRRPLGTTTGLFHRHPLGAPLTPPRRSFARAPPRREHRHPLGAITQRPPRSPETPSVSGAQRPLGARSRTPSVLH